MQLTADTSRYQQGFGRARAVAGGSRLLTQGDGGVNMLPWKSTMLLLPQATVGQARASTP